MEKQSSRAKDVNEEFRMHTVEAVWEAYGLKCVVVALAVGHRCGYVGVPPSHPAYNVRYMDYPLHRIRVHGGLTYSQSEPDYPIPTKPQLWWLGFDCAHIGDGRDLSLMTEVCRAFWRTFQEQIVGTSHSGNHVWSAEEVMEECVKLAKQLSHMSSSSKRTRGDEGK